jgi:hypothetical protein
MIAGVVGDRKDASRSCRLKGRMLAGAVGGQDGCWQVL